MAPKPVKEAIVSAKEWTADKLGSSHQMHGTGDSLKQSKSIWDKLETKYNEGRYWKKLFNEDQSHATIQKERPKAGEHVHGGPAAGTMFEGMGSDFKRSTGMQQKNFSQEGKSFKDDQGKSQESQSQQEGSSDILGQAKDMAKSGASWISDKVGGVTEKVDTSKITGAASSAMDWVKDKVGMSEDQDLSEKDIRHDHRYEQSSYKDTFMGT
jgi:hypothetical protein